MIREREHDHDHEHRVFFQFSEVLEKKHKGFKMSFPKMRYPHRHKDGKGAD